MRIFLLSTLIVIMTTSCTTQSIKIKAKAYPEIRKDTTIVEDYFGTKVSDPYRFLEDDLSDETASWVKAENEITFDYLSQIEYKSAISKRLTELYDYPKYGMPDVCGDYTLFLKNSGLQNQSVMYKTKKGDENAEVFIDFNTLSDKGTVALSTYSVSQNNKYIAYALSENGSDWVSIHVKNIETNENLSDTIRWVKFSGATWCEDGFYYSRYDAPTGSELSTKNEFQKIYYHKLGTPQSDDQLIYEDTQHPLRYFSAGVSDDNKYIFITSAEGTSGSEVLFKERTSTSSFKTLYAGFSHDYNVVECKNDKVYTLTNEAENGTLVVTNLKTLKTEPLITENEHLLESVSATENYLYATYLENASNKVYQYDFEGKLVREIKLPTLGTAFGFSAKKGATNTFYAFTSFNYPAEIFSLDIESGESKGHFKSDMAFNPENFEVEQIFATSKDATKVPMFVVYKKGMVKNGQNPLHLYSYGGFNINMTPSFSPANIMFMEQGGIYVLANIRGGGEYGEKWHKGGMKENKQNVFNDFIAAAEHLISEKYTSSERLAISGGSNGGLLIGACLTQRPDLYAVAIPRVGVLDMLRYQKFTIGWGWVVEYGTSDNEIDFDYLIKYSPLHNIKTGVCYPATMVMTADHDDRVVPAHSFKFGATLQAAQGCDNPILVRIDSNAGHGAGKPTSKSIDEQADIFAFMFYNMNFTPKF